jgi:hypothetical protein
MIIQQITDFDVSSCSVKDYQLINKKIYNTLIQDNNIKTFTNFTYDYLIDLYQIIQSFVNIGIRGLKCKSFWMDYLLYYFTWKKLEKDYNIISKTFHIKQNKFE